MTTAARIRICWWVAVTILTGLNAVAQSNSPMQGATNSFSVAAADYPDILRNGSESSKNVDPFARVGPFTGTAVKGVDTQTLYGKVMCGYQGWFGAPGDGSTVRGWLHWIKHRGPMEDGNAKVDLWPDVSELSPGE